MQSLQLNPPSIRILFVTPEKIARSDYLMRTIDTLHSRRLLVCRSISAPFPICSVPLWSS